MSYYNIPRGVGLLGRAANSFNPRDAGGNTCPAEQKVQNTRASLPGIEFMRPETTNEKREEAINSLIDSFRTGWSGNDRRLCGGLRV